MWAGSVGSPTVILGIEADAVFQIVLRSIMIPWRTIIDPDDGSHEYKALEECKARAERILRDHQVRVH